MTEQAIDRAREDLNKIISYFASQDYYRANFKNGKRRSKKHIPYTLSQETLEAHDHLSLLSGEITKEVEEQVKGYLLPFRTFRSEILKGAD